MSNVKVNGQMNLNDRLAIEVGLSKGESFKKIAKTVGRHPSTIAHEVKENRTYIHNQYPAGKDCRQARNCSKKIFVAAKNMRAAVLVNSADRLIAGSCVKDMSRLHVTSLNTLHTYVTIVAKDVSA